MSRSFLVRYLREVYAHAGALYGGLGVSVGLLLLDRFSAWHPDPWMYVFAVAAGVAVVQYRIWKSAVGKLRAQLDINMRILVEEEADMAYGMMSVEIPWNRIMSAWARLEVIEQEFKDGNFKHAGEVVAMKRTLPPVLDSYFAGAYQNSETRRRLRALLEMAKEHNIFAASELPEI